jgi:hypothetical protein
MWGTNKAVTHLDVLDVVDLMDERHDGAVGEGHHLLEHRLVRKKALVVVLA